jgi:flagellar basal-body rod modification protein FlgD
MEQGGEMAALAGVLNHHAATGQALTGSGATPMSGPASGSGTTSTTTSASSSSATITANDFLTLLVTEMKNQDPTANTDPNEYINQLVQVNSLEQLIDVNQNLVTGLGINSSSSSSSAAASQSTTSDAVNKSIVDATAQTHATAQKGVSSALPSTGLTATGGTNAVTNHVSGNLSVPDAKPASQRVARSLGGHLLSQ